MCRASDLELRKPTDVPEDIDADLIGEEEEIESEPEEYDWAEQLRQAAAAEIAAGSDCEMESDPDYEEESGAEDDDWDVLGEEEEEVQEALAQFTEWKNSVLAARLARQNGGAPSKDGPGDKEATGAEPEE